MSKVFRVWVSDIAVDVCGDHVEASYVDGFLRSVKVIGASGEGIAAFNTPIGFADASGLTDTNG